MYTFTGKVEPYLYLYLTTTCHTKLQLWLVRDNINCSVPKHQLNQVQSWSILYLFRVGPICTCSELDQLVTGVVAPHDRFGAKLWPPRLSLFGTEVGQHRNPRRTDRLQTTSEYNAKLWLWPVRGNIQYKEYYGTMQCRESRKT